MNTEVAKETLQRNRYAMDLFMHVVGQNLLLSELESSHLDMFRNARYEKAKETYRIRNLNWDENKVKRESIRNWRISKSSLKQL